VTLAAMVEVFGAERPAAVCRELTKTYEEVRREPLGALAAWAASCDVRGEITLVVAGRPAPTADGDQESLVALVLERVAGGERLKEAVADVAASAGAPKRALYDAATAARPGRSAP
jgi:16S rRNA (cytidine1402-2'-O)-methyltransferase